MARPDEGLKSDALRAALDEARAGRVARLEDLLARHGGLPGPKPNLKLAQAFGVELGSLPGEQRALLAKLAAEDAAPDTARAYLPVAAAHGFAGRIREGHEVEASWAQLLELAADERGPVRIGVLDAFVQLAGRPGFADEMVRRGADHLEHEGQRELCFGAAALIVEALADARVLGAVRDPDTLLTYLAAVVDKISDAPRAAERSEGRRRALTSLARTVPAVVVAQRGSDRGKLWLDAECARASHPDIRRVFSDAIIRLGTQGQNLSVTTADDLRKTLASSAKPLRDPTLVRPGTGRGSRSRRTR
jgi:hypothetical protein